MTTTTDNRATDDRTNPITAEGLIRRRAQQAAAAFEDAKAKFTEDFTTNPKYAIQWRAAPLVRAQSCHEVWSEIARVLDGHGLEKALAYAAERLDTTIESFFGSNSTCGWTNAVRRAEAEVHHAMARRELPELHRTAEQLRRIADERDAG